MFSWLELWSVIFPNNVLHLFWNWTWWCRWISSISRYLQSHRKWWVFVCSSCICIYRVACQVTFEKSQSPIDETETATCKIPHLTLSNDVNSEYFKSNTTLVCEGPELFYLKDSFLRINETVLHGRKLKYCVYHAITYLSGSEKRPYLRSASIPQHGLERWQYFELRITDEFFRVQCDISANHSRQSQRITESPSDEIHIANLRQTVPIVWKKKFPFDQFFIQASRKADVLSR